MMDLALLLYGSKAWPQKCTEGAKRLFNFVPIAPFCGT
jgi:hypothetical protein